jgi:hypothetical protein
MIFAAWYAVTTVIALILIGMTAKTRGDFPKDKKGRLKVLAVALTPCLNLTYAIVIFLFHREPQGFI